MKQTTKTVTRIFQARVPSHALQALQLQSSHRLVTSYLLVTLDSLLTLDIQRFPRIRRPWPELVLHETILNFISSNLAKIKTIQNSAQTKSKFMAVPGNINSGWWVWIARTAGPCVIQTAGLFGFHFQHGLPTLPCISKFLLQYSIIASHFQWVGKHNERPTGRRCHHHHQLQPLCWWGPMSGQWWFWKFWVKMLAASW
jgi:hypothetical protein